MNAAVQPPVPLPLENRGTIAPAEGMPPSTATPLILVGRVAKPVGLRGMLRIVLHTDNPDRFVPGARLHVQGPDGELRPVVLAAVRGHSHPDRIDALFEGFQTLDSARELVGKELFIPRAERAPPPAGTFYPDELAGMAVRSPAGETVGTVVRLENEVPSPFLVIDSSAHGEVLVPFRQAFIRRIDRQERTLDLRGPLELHIPG